ncbi:hypothetical protein LZ3411_1347 [Levilactobacillus zymae]|uniref:Uncharacterized protein n=1 Tax=Levilactobacillus zymae TaxID=267363 RepID=A0A1Y6JWS0_9LACO|nr:hypothetical protein LZ3411_1347 [Levilactobacillus zymae]
MDSGSFIGSILISFSAGLVSGNSKKILKPVFKLWDNWFYLTFSSDIEFKGRIYN